MADSYAPLSGGWSAEERSGPRFVPCLVRETNRILCCLLLVVLSCLVFVCVISFVPSSMSVDCGSSEGVSVLCRENNDGRQ